MANLDFCNKHNMVVFLKKSEGSEGFHQILDFINSTLINTLDDGMMKIIATIDGRIKTITKASIKRHLKLEDLDGITTLPNTKIFEQLALMGKIAEIDENPFISLVQDEETSWIQEDSEIQERTSADTKILLDQEEPTELLEDLCSGEKGKKEISIVILEVSIAAENLVYIRSSVEKRKDKGIAIMNSLS
nr:hypothetical protein [Tanacetum cinerariifolium]GFA89806.1 hypothetical protein [Tanacetum cinerariifolium]